MTYEFANYPDGTLAVFSNIGKKENGVEYINVAFERPNENDEPIYVHISEDISLHFFQIVKMWKIIHSGNIKFYC